MARVAVIGGGPAGLSTALFTAKNDLETIVFDVDETALHYAYLFNYLGIEEIDGDEFVARARDQVAGFGADLIEEEVTDVEAEASGEAFSVTTDDGIYTAEYVVFATGQSRTLAKELGCDLTDDGAIDVDRNGRTSVDGAYAAGWSTRKQKIQAAISVGDGAAVALDILSAEVEEGFHDFDTPEDAE